MGLWKDSKQLWAHAWAQSPRRVVIAVTAMLALLIGGVVVAVNDSSDASGGLSTPATPATPLTPAPVEMDTSWFANGIWHVENPFLKLPPLPMWEVRKAFKKFQNGRFGNSRGMEFPQRIKKMLKQHLTKTKNPGGNGKCVRGHITGCWWSNPWPAHSCSVAIVDCNRRAEHAVPWSKIKRAVFVCGATGAGGAFIALKTLKPKTPHTFIVAAGGGFVADSFPCALGYAAAGWNQ